MVVLVTGAAKGIGREVARQLAGQGATVIVSARDAARAQATAAELGVGALPVDLDVADEESVAAATQTLPELDVLPPIAHLTPHTLRRTFASILGVCRVDTRRAVARMGHTDARMTLGVYAQLLKLRPGDVQALEGVIGCTRDEARALLEAEDPRAVEPSQFRTNSERVSQPGPTFLAEDSS